MKILKHGKYCKNAILTCHYCGCVYRVSMKECDYRQGENIFWIDCPECGCGNLLAEEDFKTKKRYRNPVSIS